MSKFTKLPASTLTQHFSFHIEKHKSCNIKTSKHILYPKKHMLRKYLNNISCHIIRKKERLF